MILGTRNLSRSKNMMLQSNNTNYDSIQPPEHTEPGQPDNFLINPNINYKKNYQKIELDQTNSLLKINVNTNEKAYLKINLMKQRNSYSHLEENAILTPKWFDWNYYLNTNEDLRPAGITTEKDAYDHWINNGENENRECMKNYSLFKKYPNLFHKYLLGISKSERPLQYQIVCETNIIKKYICSIHCYDLSKFNFFFGEYLKPLSVFFDFVVTYVKDVRNISSQYEFTFIKMENKGMDIGSKFIAVDYLKRKNIDYSFVFFIHSKSNGFYRKRYIYPFMLNLYDIIKMMERKNIDAIFNGEIYADEKWGRNHIYMNEIISYLNLQPNFYNFPAGNFFIANKDLCESLFSDLKLYNTLNTFDSFDYSWVKTYYNLEGNYKTVYDNYVKNNLYGNNLETNLGHSGIADCMIEHVFERILFLICNRDNKNFYICDKTRGKNVFNNTKLTISAIACHTENSTKINTIVNNVHYLNEISDIIYIIDTDSFKNNNLIQSLQDSYPDACINNQLTDAKAIQYINDNPDLSHMSTEDAKRHFKVCGYKESNRLHIFSSFIFVFYCENYGYCYGKWRYFFKNIANETKYKNYILTNDSFLITKPLDEFDSAIRCDKYDLISLSASNEIAYHYTDFLRNYNSESMDVYINFVNAQLSLYRNFLDVIKNIEVPSFNLFNSRKCIYDAERDYDKNILFDDDKIMHYLNELNYPIVKLKKISVPYYDLSSVPSDFDSNEYRDLYPDLINESDVHYHFINHGMREKRYYKKHQRIYIYPPLKEYLLNYAENNRNICKIDFENYTT